MQDEMETRGFSGAPVVSAKGEVIGMVLGHGTLNGQSCVLLNPIAAIRKRLAAYL
jgi:hypothetical protein